MKMNDNDCMVKGDDEECFLSNLLSSVSDVYDIIHFCFIVDTLCVTAALDVCFDLFENINSILNIEILRKAKSTENNTENSRNFSCFF